MPGTPINRDNKSGIEKLQIDKLKNDHQEQQECHPDQPDQPPVRELTQTDRLNKRLLESVLERMSKSGEFDKFVDKEALDRSNFDKDDF